MSSKLRHAPLTADMVPLLTPGESVLLHYDGLFNFVRVRDGGQIVVDAPVLTPYDQPSAFTYIGERDADGWITCEGGWSENPVPGMLVEYRVRSGSTWALPQQVPSEALRWGCGFSGEPVAFRPAAEAAQPAASQPGISAPAEMDKKTPAHDCTCEATCCCAPAVSGEPEIGGVGVRSPMEDLGDGHWVDADPAVLAALSTPQSRGEAVAWRYRWREGAHHDRWLICDEAEYVSAVFASNPGFEVQALGVIGAAPPPAVGVEGLREAQAYIAHADEGLQRVDPWIGVRHLRTILSALQGGSDV